MKRAPAQSELSRAGVVPGGSGAAGAAARAPLYALIADRLGRSIRNGSIEPGAVILEGPVADILRSTRTPVRQALQALEQEGLVSRFPGRGYVAGPAGTPPRRVTLTAAMLDADADAGPVRKTLGWEALYEEVERDVVHLSVFGRSRINELELARHFGVGRVVARDVLLRLESLGLVEKDERLRWAVNPLDSRRINQLYELRWLLEPVALRAAAGAGGTPRLDAMKDALRRAMKAYPKVSRSSMDRLEHDLHVAFLAECGNKDLLQSLQRTRCILTLSKHVLGASAPMPRQDPFMSEHLAVLDALSAGDIDGAQALLRRHLEASCVKVTQRADFVRSTYEVPALRYVG